MLGAVTTLEDLKLLNGILRHGDAHAVDGVVDGIHSVDGDHVGSGLLSFQVEACHRNRRQAGLVFPGCG